MPSNLITTAFKHSSNSTSGSAATWSRKTIQYAYAVDVIIPTTQCSIRFTIPSDMSPPILYYYRLTNFYQNHRRYVKSFDGDQLQGKAVSAGTINGSDCAPLTSVGDKPYYPCGLVANSVFNDTFYNPVLLNVPGSSADNQTYYMTNSSGISWDSDKALYGNTSYSWDEVSVPPNWVERYPNGYSDDHHPNLVTDEGFQVWMRTAGLPTFSKLAQRNDTATMISGQYQIDIDHRTSSPTLNALCKETNITRFQRDRIWRHKSSYYIYPYRHGWQEPLPWHCICRCRRHLHRSRRIIHRHSSHQTKVHPFLSFQTMRIY
jgi:hypothetical protein